LEKSLVELSVATRESLWVDRMVDLMACLMVDMMAYSTVDMMVGLMADLTVE